MAQLIRLLTAILAILGLAWAGMTLFGLSLLLALPGAVIIVAAPRLVRKRGRLRKRTSYDPESHVSPELLFQLYRHYKGGLYWKLCDAWDEQASADLTLYADDATGRYWLRPKQMFEESVKLDGLTVKRFAAISPGKQRPPEIPATCFEAIHSETDRPYHIEWFRNAGTAKCALIAERDYRPAPAAPSMAIAPE